MTEILILIALAVAPGMAIGIYLFWHDKFEKEPLHLMIKCFFLGVVSCIIAAAVEVGLGYVFDPSPYGAWGSAIDAFALTAFVEEFSKFAWLILFAFPKKAFNEPYDGITYSVMISLGFATFENVFYVIEGGYTTAFSRMFTAVPAHTTFAIMMGFFVGLAKFRKLKAVYILLGLGVAVFFHGAYDFFLFVEAGPYIVIGALVSLAIGIGLSIWAVRIHQKNSPFHPGNLPDGSKLSA